MVFKPDMYMAWTFPFFKKESSVDNRVEVYALKI